MFGRAAEAGVVACGECGVIVIVRVATIIKELLLHVLPGTW